MNDPAILVVDDNPDHLELIVMALEDCCATARIVTASEGAQALDFLFGRGEHAGRDTTRQPRLVILDLKLVRLSGLEVLRAIRADPRTTTLPVVIHSSSVEDRDVAECYAGGASGYVRKATDFDDLRAKMRRLHDFWVLGSGPAPSSGGADGAT
ncbi:MAG TPA: response regulator [Ramlibacter sp.]|jgi:two-component system response regulator|uniref:response regulator n=1 Tax=Ramlibacter sp. TaxID=1917967 RepID=UPI002D6F36C7|nr:response regulator [Ramlibacter sp.]HZY20556.1 response regulator [Ramlibacter sp.]